MSATMFFIAMSSRVCNIGLTPYTRTSNPFYLSAYVPDPDKGYLESVMMLRREASEKLCNSCGQPVDRTVWQILPQELTPCYYPTDNSINIPASVLEMR